LANLTLVRKQNKYKKRILQPGTAEPGHWRFSRQTPHWGGEGRKNKKDRLRISF